MTPTLWSLLCGLVVGMAAMASNPSPHYGTLVLVAVACAGCGMLLAYGGSFLSMVLLLIYLGGMLVVFGFATATTAHCCAETVVSRPIVSNMATYLIVASLVSSKFWWTWTELSWSPADQHGGFSTSRGDVGGVSLIYSSGGWNLIITGWVLLLTLFVVLELTRGSSRGALRAI